MLVEVAKILTPYGTDGSFHAAIYSDVAGRFDVGNEVFLNGTRHRITQAEIHGNKGRLKLTGVQSIDDVKKISGLLLHITEDQLAELPKDRYYYFHIIGSTVIGSDGTRYGVVREIVQTGANDVFVVDTGEKELLIPALKNVVRKVDVLKKTIIIDHTLYDQ